MSARRTSYCSPCLRQQPQPSRIAFLTAGARVIDLGSAFRLKDRATWERVYGQEHPAWSLASAAVYGIPELHEESIRTATLVANPGCFSSAAILALAPLLRAGLVDPNHLIVHGLSGTAGAGADLSKGNSPSGNREQCRSLQRGRTPAYLRDGTGTRSAGAASGPCALHTVLHPHRSRDR
jgi:N-acetyl-gamma-glutamylphosphate reductase